MIQTNSLFDKINLTVGGNLSVMVDPFFFLNFLKDKFEKNY